MYEIKCLSLENCGADCVSRVGEVMAWIGRSVEMGPPGPKRVRTGAPVTGADNFHKA